jgi:hypothetical protein
MFAAWLSRPISCSSCLEFVFPEESIMWISLAHFVCLSSGRAIVRFQVFIIHPKICFDSSILPSAMNFFIDIISRRGIMSELFIGRVRVCIVNGIALLILLTLSLMSKAIPIVSSMYMSTFPVSFGGISTDIGLASLNCISSDRCRGWSKDSDKLSNSVLWSHDGLFMSVLQVSAIVSDI